MKKILFGMLVLGAMASCKKDKNDSCDANVTSIPGNYKITKVEGDYPSPLPDQDLTDQTLDACERSAIFALNANKTFTYTETGTGCSSNGSGTWDIVDTKFTLSFTNGSGPIFVDFTATPITSYDCSTFVVSEDQGSSVTFRYFFSKQ